MLRSKNILCDEKKTRTEAQHLKVSLHTGRVILGVVQALLRNKIIRINNTLHFLMKYDKRPLVALNNHREEK